jgi:hypothetical protein
MARSRTSRSSWSPRPRSRSEALMGETWTPPRERVNSQTERFLRFVTTQPLTRASGIFFIVPSLACVVHGVASGSLTLLSSLCKGIRVNRSAQCSPNSLRFVFKHHVMYPYIPRVDLARPLDVEMEIRPNRACFPPHVCRRLSPSLGSRAPLRGPRAMAQVRAGPLAPASLAGLRAALRRAPPPGGSRWCSRTSGR